MPTYYGVIRKTPKSDYWMDFPDVPGCVIGGATIEEVKAKAPEVLRAHLDALAEAPAAEIVDAMAVEVPGGGTDR